MAKSELTADVASLRSDDSVTKEGRSDDIEDKEAKVEIHQIPVVYNKRSRYV